MPHSHAWLRPLQWQLILQQSFASSAFFTGNQRQCQLVDEHQKPELVFLCHLPSLSAFLHWHINVGIGCSPSTIDNSK